MFQNQYADRSSDQIASIFGSPFAAAVNEARTGSWQGPIESGLGWHLVFVTSVNPGRVPSYDEVEPQIKAAWLDEQRRAARQRAFEAMKAHYEVRLPEALRIATAPGASEREIDAVSIAGRFFRCIARFLAIAGAAIVAHHPGAMAHEARPAYLELTETQPDRYDVVWRTPVSAGQRLPVVLQLPDGVSTVVEPRLREYVDSVVERRIIVVPGGLGGKRIEFVGLQATITDVLVRVQTRDGARSTTLVHPSRPWLEIAPARGSFAVAGAYLVHGIEHILLGYDHLLFVLALILIVRNLRVLIATVTAFTVAHSITLALATLGVVHVPGPPVEAAIALSILLLASRDRADKRRTTEPHSEVALVGGVLVRPAPRLRLCECAFRDWTATRRHSTGAIHVQSRCRDRTTGLHRRRPGVARRGATNSGTAELDASGSTGGDLRDRHTGRVLVRRAHRRICVMRRCRPGTWPRVASLLGSCFLGLLTATSFAQQVGALDGRGDARACVR